MCFNDEFYKCVLLALYCFISWCLANYVSLQKYHMLFDDELYEGIASLTVLPCWRHCIALFSLLMINMLHNIHFPRFLVFTVNEEWLVYIHALTYQFLSNVRSSTPILQYLFVNALPYQNICTCWWSTKCITRFSIGAQWFLGQPQYDYGFSNFSLILRLQYTWNGRIYIKVGT